MEYSRDSKWVLFVCLRVICGDCLLCKGYICQHHAALMYEGCHWEQHKWAAHRCPLPLLLSQHHILMISLRLKLSLRLKQTLCCKSILWINSDGFCGLGCHPQCEGAEGCVVPAWSCPTTASVLHGWVQPIRVWVTNCGFAEKCAVFQNVWAWVRGDDVEEAQGPVSPCCGQGSWPYLESSLADNRDKKLQWFWGSEMRSLCIYVLTCLKWGLAPVPHCCTIVWQIP